MKSLLLQINTLSDSLSTTAMEGELVEEKTLSILELISSGGTGGNIIMITLGVLSVISVYLFIERYTTLNKARKIDSSCLNSIKNYVQDKDIKAAKTLCKNTDTCDNVAFVLIYLLLHTPLLYKLILVTL